jgi:hypothetical protein
LSLAGEFYFVYAEQVNAEHKDFLSPLGMQFLWEFFAV